MGIYVGWLVDAARMAVAGTGKQVIVSPGWQTRGQGGLRVLEVVVGHHTATPESAPGDYPSLNVVQNGRAGLIGLLSQLGLGRSGNVYVMGAGLAYHAGSSAYAGFVDLNDESIGIEAEDSGDGTWTPDQLFMYPRLVGACLAYMRRGPDRYASHRTVAVPAGRKTDPAGISDAWMRQQVAAQSQQENDMDSEQDRMLRVIYTELTQKLGITETGYVDTMAGFARNAARDSFGARAGVATLHVKVDALRHELSDDEANIIAAVREIIAALPDGAPADVALLAAALAPVLSPMIQAGATPAQVEEAVRKVFASAGQAGGNPA